MGRDPNTNLLQARANIKQKGLTGALENLRYRRGNIFEFEPVGITDDKRFREANPEHPMAEPQRFIRIEAADFINDIAGTKPDLIDDSVLEQSHEALFNRCAAVRMAIAQALGKLGRPKSSGVLRRLLETEDESQWVRDAAEQSLRRIQNAGA